MNETENNFDELRRLLQLKRHEAPPPGYFNRFSGQVIERIRVGEAERDQSISDRIRSQAPWIFDLLHVFQTNPGIVVGSAISLCLLLVVGVIFAEHSDTTLKSVMASSANVESPPVTSIAAPALAASAAPETSGIAVSTNPVTSLQPAATLFGQQNPLFQSASFAPAGN